MHGFSFFLLIRWSDGTRACRGKNKSGLQDHRMPSESGDSTPPGPEVPPPTIISATSQSLCPHYLLKPQNLPSHLTHLLLAKFRLLASPLRRIHPAPPRNPRAFSRRQPVYARDGVFVSPVRDTPSRVSVSGVGETGETAGAETTSPRCCDRLRGFASRCPQLIDKRFLILVTLFLAVGVVVAYVRWMIWRYRGDSST